MGSFATMFPLFSITFLILLSNSYGQDLARCIEKYSQHHHAKAHCEASTDMVSYLFDVNCLHGVRAFCEAYSTAGGDLTKCELWKSKACERFVRHKVHVVCMAQAHNICKPHNHPMVNQRELVISDICKNAPLQLNGVSCEAHMHHHLWKKYRTHSGSKPAHPTPHIRKWTNSICKSILPNILVDPKSSPAEYCSAVKTVVNKACGYAVGGACVFESVETFTEFLIVVCKQALSRLVC